VAPAHADRASGWVGRSTTALGLRGPVPEGALRQLLAGCNPGTGSPLLRRSRPVAAYDLTFAAQKSVSVLFALGSRETSEQVVAAHRAAVGAGLAYIETSALAVRRGSGDDRVSIPTDGMLGARFDHCLSRAGDPHLHSHVVVANMAYGSDGRWSGVDGRGLFVHARAAGALYDAHLRAELTARLGVTWTWREPTGWDLPGADPVLLAAFSGRAGEIKQALADRGSSSRQARQVAWAATRDSKAHHGSEADLHLRWATRARIAPELGLQRDPAVGLDLLDEHRFAAGIAQSGPSGVCRRDVVAAWSAASAQGGSATDLLAAVDHWAPRTPGSLGVAEARRSSTSCVPAPHLLRGLGPRPSGSSGQALWRDAASAIERYRDRWGVHGPSPLGTEREPLARLGHRRLADHLEVSRTVRDALTRLGGRPVASLERDGLTFERR
jgi:conjugative relaxase-like TrwC/TraI family protein